LLNPSSLDSKKNKEDPDLSFFDSRTIEKHFTLQGKKRGISFDPRKGYLPIVKEVQPISVSFC
jgi:hypothetical protein